MTSAQEEMNDLWTAANDETSPKVVRDSLLDQMSMLKRRSKQAWRWFGRKDNDVGNLRCKIHARPEPNQLLIDFFNSPEGLQFGREGDHRGWNPHQTAIHFLKILSLDARLVNLERTLAETITDIQTNLDRTQLVVDSLREIAYK